jgi:hypothetical protein
MGLSIAMEASMNFWLAFGFGLILGAFGMATLLGILMLRADDLSRKKLPRIIMGYFETKGTDPEPHWGQGTP